MYEVMVTYWPLVNNDHASSFGLNGTRFLLIIGNTATFYWGELNAGDDSY